MLMSMSLRVQFLNFSAPHGKDVAERAGRDGGFKVDALLSRPVWWSRGAVSEDAIKSNEMNLSISEQ